MCVSDAARYAAVRALKKSTKGSADYEQAKRDISAFNARHTGNTWRLSRQLEELTKLEARVTILGYLQRGGTPSSSDRLLATRLGSMCVELIEQECFGVLVADRGGVATPVPIGEVAGNLKLIPPNHAWVQSARRVGTCFGD